MSDTSVSAKPFNSDASKWDVSSMTDMHDMVLGTTTFNSGISKWDVSSVNGKYDTISTHTQQTRFMQGNKLTHGRA